MNFGKEHIILQNISGNGNYVDTSINVEKRKQLGKAITCGGTSILNDIKKIVGDVEKGAEMIKDDPSVILRAINKSEDTNNINYTVDEEVPPGDRLDTNT